MLHLPADLSVHDCATNVTQVQTRSATGRISAQDTHITYSGLPIDQGGSNSYGYDYAGRLLGSTNTQGQSGWTQSFSYDAAGRMRTNSLVGTYAYANATVARHAPSTVTPISGTAQTFAYDLNGNMTTGLNGKIMTYDGENRPLSVTLAGTKTCYVYGADGSRLKRIDGYSPGQNCASPTASQPVTVWMGPLEIRRFLQTSSEKLMLYPTADIRIVKYMNAGSPVVQKSVLHRDGLSSVRVVTDDVGLRTESSSYHPFGEQAETVNNPAAMSEMRGYIGQVLDAGAGLQYLNARYYDPQLAMFIQPDWWEVTKEGVGTNRYSYSFNDPINAKDPSGHNSLKTVYDAIRKILRSKPNSVAKATISSVEAARVRAVEDAWKMEIQMVQQLGYGTRKWTPPELEILKSGKKVPGYVGDHITSVSADLTKAADQSNIQFLTPAEHSARHAKYGGTREPIFENRSLDRTDGGRLPDLSTEGAKSWPERAAEVLDSIANSRAMSVLDLFDPVAILDEGYRQQRGFGLFEGPPCRPQNCT